MLRLRLAEYYLELLNKLIWNLDGNLMGGGHIDLDLATWKLFRFSCPKMCCFTQTSLGMFKWAS